MKREIDCVLNFLVGLVETNSNIQFELQSNLEVFRRRLGSILTKIYEGHWFPDEPCKDQEYRSIRISSPEFQHAVMTCGLTFKSLRLPPELTVWVDPGEVRYRLKGGSPCIACFKDDEGTFHDVQDISLTHKSVDSANTRRHRLNEKILKKWGKANSLVESYCKHLIKAQDHVQTIVADETIVYKFYMEKDEYDPELVAYFSSKVLKQLWGKIRFLKNQVSDAIDELEILYGMIKGCVNEIKSEINVTYSDKQDTIIDGNGRTFTVNELQLELETLRIIFRNSHWRRIMHYNSAYEYLTTQPPITGWHLSQCYEDYWGDGPALLASKGVLDSFFQRKDLKFQQDMH